MKQALIYWSPLALVLALGAAFGSSAGAGGAVLAMTLGGGLFAALARLHYRRARARMSAAGAEPTAAEIYAAMNVRFRSPRS